MSITVIVIWCGTFVWKLSSQVSCFLTKIAYCPNLMFRTIRNANATTYAEYQMGSSKMYWNCLRDFSMDHNFSSSQAKPHNKKHFQSDTFIAGWFSLGGAVAVEAKLSIGVEKFEICIVDEKKSIWSTAFSYLFRYFTSFDMDATNSIN